MSARVRKRRETGRCEGRKPFGTRPGEAEILGLMRKLRRKPKGGERLSFDAIADRLNATGVPTRTGARWRGPTVWGIVRRAPVNPNRQFVIRAQQCLIEL